MDISDNKVGIENLLTYPEDKLSADAKLIKNYFIRLIRHMPNNVYWVDKNGVTLGCNYNVLKFVGVENFEDVVGKSYEEIAKTAGWTEKQTMSFKNDDQEVIKTGKPKINVEELVFYDKQGKPIYYLSSRIPLFDENNNVVGIVGISVNMADQKEKEQLQFENEKYLIAELELQKKIVEQKEKFTNIAAQVAHDIRSPLASLQILLKSCQDIPEKERIALREATTRIQDIANNLLTHYSGQDKPAVLHQEEAREPVFVSALMLELLTEKKLQYQDLPVKLCDEFSESGYFAFMTVQSSAFKRMLSNLINNAVEALENKATGSVLFRLDADAEWITIRIEDNGKGMQPEFIEKIKNNMAVTEGKQQGYGLGWTQAREALQHNHGEFLIESQYGAGTKITLTFPRIQAPAWIAEKIKLREDSILIILDDDQSIHTAWDSRFESIVTENPNMRLIHFTQGEEALIFLQDLPQSERKKVFLLSDYELLKQSLTGLDVIEESGIKKAVLVTSHYASQEIRERAAKTGTKILPKLLASEIPIVLNKQQEEEEPAGLVEIVIIDDNQALLNVLIYNFSLKKRIAEGFSNPYPFLNRLADFPKTIPICFDYDFKLPDIDGFELARQLHEQGYTKLYMLTGMGFEQNKVPSYLTLISKDKAVDLLELL